MFEPGSFKWAHGDPRISESLEEKRRREDRRRFNEERRKKFFACAFPTLRECAGGMLVILCCYFVVWPLFQLMYLSAEAHRELEEMRRANEVRVAAVPTAVAATPVREEVVREGVVKHLLNLDADPYVPAGLTVAKDGHRKMGKNVELERRGEDLYLGGKKIILHLSSRQIGGRVIQGHELREELSGKGILNANVLDYLFDHPNLIPESWKKDEAGNTRLIYFWGTIYRGSSDDLYVRCLCWDDSGWSRGRGWLGSDWDFSEPAALAE